MTYEEFMMFTMQRDVYHELIYGVPALMPAPFDAHAVANDNLLYLLKDCFRFFDKKCKVRHTPYDVYLDGLNHTYQPDICVICSPHKIKKHGCVGSPDLIIEVLSESTENKDRIIKKNIYLSHGVKEYWIVNTWERCIEIWLDINTCTTYYDSDTIISPTFSLIEFDVSLVFED